MVDSLSIVPLSRENFQLNKAVAVRVRFQDQLAHALAVQIGQIGCFVQHIHVLGEEIFTVMHCRSLELACKPLGFRRVFAAPLPRDLLLAFPWEQLLRKAPLSVTQAWD